MHPFRIDPILSGCSASFISEFIGFSQGSGGHCSRDQSVRRVTWNNFSFSHCSIPKIHGILSLSFILISSRLFQRGQNQ